MSSRDRMIPSRRALLRAAPALGALALVSACGFKPLHGAGGDVLRGQVDYDVPVGRTGYAMRETLMRRLGQGVDGADWTLSATLVYEAEGLAITEDNAISRYVLRGISDWALTGPDGEVALSGQAQALSAYGTDSSLFASRAGERDAELRVAQELAERIAERVAAALAAGEGPAGLRG